MDVQQLTADDKVFARARVDDLKGRSVRGGVVAIIAQGIKFALQTASMMILARLLSPEDYGLQGMVVAITGFLGLFKDAGLSLATVQRDEVTRDQVSTLFWINFGVGALLTALAAVLAPLLVYFYREPRLYWVVIVSATAFLFNGLGTQHQALLQRHLRFVTLAKIDVLSLGLSSAIGIAMALLGQRYWALVGAAVSASLISTIGAWISVPWIPGKPVRGSGVRSMLHFGGTYTINMLLVYIAYNTEKILLGRFFGAEALGIYGRAYQLVNLPVQQLNSSISGVAFPALSRMQDNPDRVCRYFLRGYTLFLSITIPITIGSVLFGGDIIGVMFGGKWAAAVPIFRLLAPTILVFALINPLGWFLLAIGRAARSLKMALLIVPVVICGIVAGLPYGPKGVAMGYSIAMAILVLPLIAWAKHGTPIKGRDFWKAIRDPLLAGFAATIAGLIFTFTVADVLPPLARLAVGLTLLMGVYAWVLLIVLGQKTFYLDLLNQVLRRAPAETA
jgi:O-antigen/teichoic acid export membrane protein